MNMTLLIRNNSQVIAEAAARRNSHSREGQKHLEDIFRMLYTLMRRSLESIKETALLAAGLIGRYVLI